MLEPHCIPGAAMPALDWFQLLAIGILAGSLGQSVRVIVGLKKASDTAQPGTTMSDNIDVGRLLISLLIGAVAGALAAITTLYKNLAAIAPEMFLGLMAAGYAGSDFIEGFMNKFMPNSSANPPPTKGASYPDGAAG